MSLLCGFFQRKVERESIDTEKMVSTVAELFYFSLGW